MKDEIRIGIIGAGANTKLRHIPNLQAIDGVKVVGVCNRSRDSSQKVATEFGIPKIYKNWQEVILDEKVDAVVIGTWPYLHCPATLGALEGGKHVLVEARMGMNADEARKMLGASVGHPELVTQVVPSPMTLEVDETIRRHIHDGLLGRLLVIEVRDGGGWLDPDAPMHWREDIEFSGLNTLTLGIWYEAILRWVGQAHKVLAMGEIFVKSRKCPDGSIREVKIPDHLDVVAAMQCGAQMHIQVSSVCGLSRPAEVLLFGSDGTMRFSEGRLFGAPKAAKQLEEIHIPSERRGRWRVEEEFIGAIRGEEPVRLTTFEDGVKYMEFTEAVAQSMATGHVVPVEDLELLERLEDEMDLETIRERMNESATPFSKLKKELGL